MSETKEEIIREYSNGEITIVWKPAKCIHVKYCWKELLDVFDPNKRPWVNAYGATTERIIQQIERCPSEALSYFYNEKEGKVAGKAQDTKPVGCLEVEIEVTPDGPLIATGNLAIKGKDGKIEHTDGKTAFCRCGATKNSPYCDGSHIEIKFKG